MTNYELQLPAIYIKLLTPPEMGFVILINTYIHYYLSLVVEEHDERKPNMDKADRDYDREGKNDEKEPNMDKDDDKEGEEQDEEKEGQDNDGNNEKQEKQHEREEEGFKMKLRERKFQCAQTDKVSIKEALLATHLNWHMYAKYVNCG